MQLQLRPATLSDIPDIVTIGLSAFRTNPMHARIFPRDLPASDAFWTSTLTDEFENNPNTHFLIVEDISPSTTTTSEDQKPTFVGFAKWNLVPANYVYPTPPKSEIWPADPALAEHFFGILFERHEALMGPRRHWYLELIGTREEYHGLGAGAMMVGWGTARADEEGVEAYLDSTPAGRRLYEKFGFEGVEMRWFLGGEEEEEYGECFMIRGARGRE
ncbi:acyl-CoA N-acyltransferase [Cercophora scortea]|uniref:Acyl-CoA N-acyltransferase n=1 Tax=Cercophora scortea TaxID=314031 RepID=A0AAE0IND5_9PEZI|nr:acyl-CoA N-acyltransferase [Cercophora scortea]